LECLLLAKTTGKPFQRSKIKTQNDKSKFKTCMTGSMRKADRPINVRFVDHGSDTKNTTAEFSVRSTTLAVNKWRIDSRPKLCILICHFAFAI